MALCLDNYWSLEFNVNGFSVNSILLSGAALSPCCTSAQQPLDGPLDSPKQPHRLNMEYVYFTLLFLLMLTGYFSQL